MKYLDLLGKTVIDADCGQAMGRILEILTQDGTGIEAFRLWDENNGGRVFLAACKSVVLREEILLAHRRQEDLHGFYAYQRNIPLITKAGCVSGTVQDYEFDACGHCLQIMGSQGCCKAEDVCIGAQAVIEKETEKVMVAEIKQANEPPSLEEEPGCELLGRIALREIRNALGEAVLAKGAKVDRESLRRAIDEGWLVALAAGTAAKHT